MSEADYTMGPFDTRVTALPRTWRGTFLSGSWTRSAGAGRRTLGLQEMCQAGPIARELTREAAIVLERALLL